MLPRSPVQSQAMRFKSACVDDLLPFATLQHYHINTVLIAVCVVQFIFAWINGNAKNPISCKYHNKNICLNICQVLTNTTADESPQWHRVTLSCQHPFASLHKYILNRQLAIIFFENINSYSRVVH